MDEVTAKRIRILVRDDDFDGAVDEYRKLSRRQPLCPVELVDMAQLMQLDSGETGTLADIESLFHTALRRDREYLPALIGLGWFKFAVTGETIEALRYFRSALEISRKFEAEILDGLNQCEEELGEEESDS